MFCRVSGSLPSFQHTSSPELDNLLETFRSNVFLPAHLRKAQRDIIYRPKNHHLLSTEEPATVAIGDEVLQLRPLNRMRDEPLTRTSIIKILQLMREAKNWQNLAPFLIGLRNSQRVLRQPHLEKMVRTACEQGNEGAIMECLRQSEKTGVELWQVGVAVELMWRAMGRAIEGNWTEEAVDRGLRLADSLWIMMQDPKHANEQLLDPTQCPETVGVMVQLHAAKAVMFHEQKDIHGKVVEYTQRLLALWEKMNFPNSDSDVRTATLNLMKWAPVWHGMKMARKVSEVTSEMKKELGIRVKEVEVAMEAARNIVYSYREALPVEDQEKATYYRRGVGLYEKLSSVSS